MGAACSSSSDDAKPGELVIKKPSDVAKHKNAKSCWITMNGRIYDVTPFLKQHPGGAQMLLMYGGKDATTAFNAVHTHTSYAKDILKQFHIGYLPDMAPKPGAPVAEVKSQPVVEHDEDPFAGLVGAAAAAVPPQQPVVAADFKWKFELDKIDKVTADTSLFHFKVGMDSAATQFLLAPGQHIYVNIPGVGEKPYTPTNHSNGNMSLLVKTYASGQVSAAIHRLTIGSGIDVRSSAPKFDWKSVLDGRYSFIGMIAGGTGVTPMVQIIRGILECPDMKSPPRMSLILSNKTDDDVLLKAQLTSVAESHPGVLTITFVSSRSQGRITSSQVSSIWQQTLSSASETALACICGPAAFTSDIAAMCESLGFQKEDAATKKLFVF